MARLGETNGLLYPKQENVMPRPGRQPIVDVLKPILKDHGFRKVAQTWRRTQGDFIQVFNLQASQWSDAYYFNAGVYVRSQGTLTNPTEACCDVRWRLDSHLRDQPGKPDVLDMERAIDPAVRARHIARMAGEAVDWLEAISSRQAIADLIKRKEKNRRSDPGIWPRRGAYAYIGQPLAPVQPVKKVKLMFKGKGTTVDIGDKATVKAWVKKIISAKPKQ